MQAEMILNGLSLLLLLVGLIYLVRQARFVESGHKQAYSNLLFGLLVIVVFIGITIADNIQKSYALKFLELGYIVIVKDMALLVFASIMFLLSAANFRQNSLQKNI